MEGARQFRLLLWKDYLTRKRNIVTVCGVLWSTLVMFCLYAVRNNIDNEDFPTCQFAARALPSAGILTFLQSFICNVNNECDYLNKYEEIPTFENAKLTHLQRQLSPVLENEEVMGVAGTVPDALKLIATLARIVDEPTFVHISKHGMKVRDLFLNPNKAATYISSQLDLSEELVGRLMDAPLSIQGLTTGSLDRCSAKSLSETVSMDKEDMKLLVEKLCPLSSFETQRIMMGLMLQVNFSKYIKLVGNMYSRLSGDNRISSLGDTATAVVRMTDQRSYEPLVAMSQVKKDEDFSYVSVDYLPKLVDQFQPTFGDTEFYKSLKEYIDTFVTGLKYLSKFMGDPRDSGNLNGVKLFTGALLNKLNKNSSLDQVIDKVNDAFDTLKDVGNKSDSDLYDMASKLTNFVLKLTSQETKHQIIFYTTLLAKLMEAMNSVLKIDMNLEQIVYNASLRNPEGVKILLRLKPNIVSKAFDALTDAEKTQVMTRNFDKTEDMFCNANRLKDFFAISLNDAESLRNQLCNDAWKKYVTDLIQSFGIYEVKEKINAITAILIQETLGKDTSSQLYTIEHNFKVLEDFVDVATKMHSQGEVKQNWEGLFDVKNNSEFLKVLTEKRHLRTQILITVHGSLAKEIVTQNTILNFKISPSLRDITFILSAINKQLNSISLDLIAAVKMMYPDILMTFINTALNEDKTYKCLSTPSESIACQGLNTSLSFLELPSNLSEAMKLRLLGVMCNASIEVERALNNQSYLGHAISIIMSAKHTPFGSAVDWTELIEGVKNLYIKLDRDYPYLFEAGAYGMSEDTKSRVDSMAREVKTYWFGRGTMLRSVHLGMKILLRVMDVVDYDVFNVHGERWLQIKYSLQNTLGVVRVLSQIFRATAAALNNEVVTSEVPEETTEALVTILPNLPRLLYDGVDVIVNDDTDIAPIISLMNAPNPWPCSNSSISEFISLSENSSRAVASLEKILCLDDQLQEKWREYIDKEHARISNFNLTKSNKTSYENHLFLHFSASLDDFLKYSELVRDRLYSFFEGSISFDGLNMATAWDRAVESFSNGDKDVVIRKFLTKVDTVINSIEIPSTYASIPVSTIWDMYKKCLSSAVVDNSCRKTGMAAWTSILKYSATVLLQMSTDMMTYLTEVRDPNSNLLQVFGFTNGTALFDFYEKFPEYVTTLLNSYMDYNFMSQVRRASQTEFWECEAVVNSLLPPPYSEITSDSIKTIQPYVCPYLFYWIGLPRGENVLMDMVAKPQYYFFTSQSSNLSSNFTAAFNEGSEVLTFLKNITNKTQNEEHVEKNTISEKIKNAIDSLLNYKINITDPHYVKFNNVMKIQIAANIYLTKIVAMVNKLSTSVNDIKHNELKDLVNDTNKLEDDLVNMKALFKGKPSEAIAFHFDVITEFLWTKDYSLVEIIDKVCKDVNVYYNNILTQTDKFKTQLCRQNYTVIYNSVKEVIVGDYKSALFSLKKLVRVLKDDNEEINNIAAFFSRRQPVVAAMQTSIGYSYDLGLPIYLKYLHSNIQQYDIILSFLTGGDWWQKMREQYNGPHFKELLNGVENSFSIAEDFINNFDKIHIARLLHDVDFNRSDALCQLNTSLSEYLPDGTGVLSATKAALCQTDRLDVYKEIPPLLFASQGYDSELELPRAVNYTALDLDLSSTYSKLNLLIAGPQYPKRPNWITDQEITEFKKYTEKLTRKDSIVKLYFGVMSNMADAATLFLNNSACTYCSQTTSWLKQLNLQLIKKQEYDVLLCHLDQMTLQEVHYSLNNEFHWDLSIREILLTRNYTNLELNKALNEFLEQTKLHLLDELAADTTRLENCLNKNVSRNEFGDGALLIKVLSHTIKLIRAEMPYLYEIEGFADVPALKQLYTEVAHKLDVIRPLNEYLKKNTINVKLEELVDKEDLNNILNADINLRLANLDNLPPTQYLRLQNASWPQICAEHNCSQINSVLSESLDKTLIAENLPKLQKQDFWRFKFLTSLLDHSEQLLRHVARLIGVASRLDVPGLLSGKLAPMVDLIMTVLTDDNTNDLVYSINGVVQELRPVLNGSALEHDLEALANGLTIIQDYKNSVLEQDELKLEVSKVFSNPEKIESSLSELGINNTNFWSIAAPRIHAGHLMLKPLFIKQDPYHISNFVCQINTTSLVIHPGNVDVVSTEEVLQAVIDQFCALSDAQAKEMIPVIMANLNFSYVIEKVSKVVLTKLYAAANLTQSQGELVIQKYPEMLRVMPLVQEKVGYVKATLANETMFQNLKDFSNIGNLLGSSDFLSSAGNMVCGRPFSNNLGRFYKTVAETKDFSSKPDPRQLEVLPTDFCRSLYTDILKIQGGKIVWSFVKPLIMGKIIFTPPVPAVHRIISKANSTFSVMYQLTDLVHTFARAFSSVEQLSAHREGVAVLRRLLSSPVFASLKRELGADVSLSDVNVEGIFDEFGDLKDAGSLLHKASQLLQCINLDRFTAAPDVRSLEHRAVLLTEVNEFSAGLVFSKVDEKDESPVDVEYTIRMDIENVPTTTRKKNQYWTPGPEGSFLEDMRYFRGFVQIQDVIDKAIIELARNSSRRIHKREVKDVADWSVYTQQIPYPCYRKDYFQATLYESQALVVAFFVALVYTVSSAVRFIVHDKETGNTMLMSVMGVKLKYHTLSWLVASLSEAAACCLGMTLVLCLGHVLPRSDPSLLYVLMFVFSISVMMFSYMLSKLFSSASSAAVCAALAYMVSFMPYVIVAAMEAHLSLVSKLFTCLSMSSAFSYAWLLVTRLEARGYGASWAGLWATDDAHGMSIGLTIVIMLVDALIYFAIGAVIDKCNGIKTLKSNITFCESLGEKAGVSIVNITKVYNERSRKPHLALDNVSIELQKGQITTLLGHNGAGKTTLVKILMGMLKPTKGHIIVRGDKVATRVGVCPQRDVLYEHMSAREHVALYAQLKSGLPLEQLKDEIESMLQVLSLSSLSREPVHRLSGGTRRRLCVALAFVARPGLVSLDEPTSGVDPAARREIWSMIMKLKEDRTVLLTTHHLDEAELLSDQIVIMHKGQIHTTGSPIEIKRTLGTGYKLQVSYPKKLPDYQDDTSVEEKSKELMSVVRDVVKNAYLSDVTDTNVEITMPFFDANGLNNDFLSACKSVEEQQAQLGYSSFGVECSSLEQVFSDICSHADGEAAREATIAAAASHPEESSLKTTSTSSIKAELEGPLVPMEGPLKGTTWDQFTALIHARYLHYIRNKWLLFMLIMLPSLFVTIAMAFSMIRPPADNEVPLLLKPELYGNTTQFIVPSPSRDSSYISPEFAEDVMQVLMDAPRVTDWTDKDTPLCKCTETRQECDLSEPSLSLPDMMSLPDTKTLNEWLVASQEFYIEKRYGGFSSSIKNNRSNLVAWYNNKGHHSMPSFVNALHSATLRAAVGGEANINTYTHPLKISKEQLSKSTILEHVADAGITAMLLVAACLVPAGGAVYLVRARTQHEQRLQLLCGVSPALYWTTTLLWDLLIMLVNVIITVCVLEAFGFPVFVYRNNLPAICILMMLFGYACGCLVHVMQKLFTDASLANMVLFCGNFFVGIIGVAVLLILDVVSKSDETDRIREVVHNVFLIFPQFVFVDGLLEIAKNTIKAQVLSRFGMDTYADPLHSSMLTFHFTSLLVVGTLLFLLNLAIEYDYFECIIERFKTEWKEQNPGALEPPEVLAERKRVQASLDAAHDPLIPTIGYINAGYVVAENKAHVLPPRGVDVAACVGLGKQYAARGGARVALRDLTLGVPPGQCTALLGQNGAGKSTTFSMWTGQLRPSAGRMVLAGRPVSPSGLCTGRISYCPQSDAIDPLLTVKETLQFYCKLRGISDKHTVIKRTLRTMELDSYSGVPCGELSGGNKRKLCCAVALMARTSLVLLDEPTSGMDVRARACVSRAVRGACAARRGCVVSTHALHDARALAARVALLHEGELAALATVDDCLTRFGGGYVLCVRARCVRRAWRELRARAPHAQLRAAHAHALQVLLPARATLALPVDGKPVQGAAVSDAFRLLAQLQADCDVDDYTISQSSLDEMFLNCSNKPDLELDLPSILTPTPVEECDDELTSITAL